MNAWKSAIVVAMLNRFLLIFCGTVGLIHILSCCRCLMTGNPSSHLPSCRINCRPLDRLVSGDDLARSRLISCRPGSAYRAHM